MPGRRQPIFVREIVISRGEELKEKLLEQGLDTDEVVFKYLWPRYAPPAAAGIRSIVKSEHLRPQFDRLVELHRIVRASVPLPVGVVLSAERDFVGYVLEYVEGPTLEEIIQGGALDEARRRLASVEETIARLHAKGVAHGDVTTSNVLAADDGRTLLIDPVATPGPHTLLQDDLCLEQIRQRLDA